ncbi:hypothetical protein E5358_12530 [Palleniella muris]|uniref:Uncharacterized protein n=1 Tax=Palleniella muris TaxID=3038145 RepID=A0AC61QNV4_9BACT|nr:hypothetical protein [Palleniella muris]TGX80591.1 hypothetical protein E5358_12530 [Palleniella muris]
MKIELFINPTSLDVKESSKFAEINELNELMTKHFIELSYSKAVENYSIGMICVRNEFLFFFTPHKPKYYKEKIFSEKETIVVTDEPLRWYKQLNCELILDFNEFCNSSKQEGYNIIAHTVMDFLEQLKYPVAIRKSFDKERFNNDMREFFRSIGCDV